MKKINTFTFIIFAVLLLFILMFDYPKKFISRLIFSHELSLLTHSVFNKINNEIYFDMKKRENQKKTLIVLNNYVYDFFKLPRFTKLSNLDDGASWKMLHGSIACDGVTDIFLRLAENTNARGVMIFLYNNDNISPHTLSFFDLNDSIGLDDSVDLSHSINYLENNSELNKMYLFDPSYNYFPINKKSQFVNIKYMLKNKIEFSNYEELDSDNIKLNLLQNHKQAFIANRVYDEYSIISKLSLKFVKVLPTNFLKFLFKFGIFINPELDDDYKELLYARLEHILLNYDDAKVNYSKISHKNRYYDNAQYWYERINTSQSVLKKYEDIFSPLTNSIFPKDL
tara:strand:+ start:325 stop:1344 length:1020 start_codon:yes stop_codon:yes gene_type:complete